VPVVPARRTGRREAVGLCWVMRISPRDGELIQIVDAAMAEAARKSGSWLVCRPGCSSCCLGPFEITPLDAVRLRQGLADLETSDPERAARVRTRAQSEVARIARLLDGDNGDEPCPALDPEAGTCDLYAARPITCRTFGPPVRIGSESVGVCYRCRDGFGGRAGIRTPDPLGVNEVL
jgi:Fe-S-cluster containining protein